jgi:hypothetical protein
MNARVTRSVIAVSGALLVAGTLAAQNGMPRSRQADRRVVSNHVTATAALDPIDAVEGWGRIAVRDQPLWNVSPETRLAEDGHRLVTINLWGLATDSSYRVVVDGFPVADVVTDPYGDAKAMLESPPKPGPGIVWPEVPEDLPAAMDLVRAEVYGVDEGGAEADLVLEGLFTTRWSGTGGAQQVDLVYFERIELDSAAGTFKPRGVAKLAQDVDAVLTFSTHACGLEPGEVYEIWVGGTAVGTVEADAVGYASLQLSSTGDGEVLPPDLVSAFDPAPDVGGPEGWLVDWWYHANDGANPLVLSGAFTGVNMLGCPCDGCCGGGGNGGQGGNGGGNGGQGGNGGGNGGQGGNGGGNGGQGGNGGGSN